MISNRGSYLLFVAVERSLDLEVGALGTIHLKRGSFIYSGSAMGGLHARTLRHLCRSGGKPQSLRRRLTAFLGQPERPTHPKRLRWHIDYLLEHEAARVAALSLLPDQQVECQLAMALQNELGATIPHPGFGSGDCHEKCGAHLMALAQRKHPEARRMAGTLVRGARHLLVRA